MSDHASKQSAALADLGRAVVRSTPVCSRVPAKVAAAVEKEATHGAISFPPAMRAHEVAPWWVGPAWADDEEGRTALIEAARAKERTNLGYLHFSWFRVPGCPENLASILNCLLSLVGQAHQLRAHLAEIDSIPSKPTMDGYVPVRAPRVEHWYDRDMPIEVREVSLELIEAVPLGADLRGVQAALAPVLAGWRHLGPVPLRHALEGAGLDPMDALRSIRERLAAAPAWPAEVGA